MSIRQPPRLAVWLLTLLSVERQTLAGDLLEEFAAGRSRWWFWQQVLSAVATDVVVRKRRPITLGLADDDARTRSRARRVAVRESRYLSRTLIRFLRGCVLLVLGVYVILYMPPGMWRVFAWLSLWSLLGGVVCGIVLVFFRHHRQTTPLEPGVDKTRIQ